MSSTETLIKAAINRLSARFGQKIVDVVTDLSEKAKDTPEKVKSEWETLKDEIYEEANRLERDMEGNIGEQEQKEQKKDLSNPQEYIDNLRLEISKLNKKIEERH